MTTGARSTHTRRGFRAAVGLAVLAVLFTCAPASAHRAMRSKIVRTEYGVPHITAPNLTSLGFGYGYAFAQDDLCTIADSYVTVAGQRSRYFGPNGQWTFSGNGTVNNNLDSDFYYRSVNRSGVIERLIHSAPPKGPLPGVKQAVHGYVHGYNAYLRRVSPGGRAGERPAPASAGSGRGGSRTGVDNLPDPRCRGASWVHPISAMDVYRRFYQLGTLASAGAAIDGIGGAAPVLDPSAAAAAEGREHAALSRVVAGKQGLGPFPLSSGSNAIGLGSQATQNGRGMVLGNPHFPWFGSERLYQVQLRVPGRLNVSGASLYGVPVVLIGQTRGLAWSHTVATAWRFTPYELTLAPNDPHSYVVDGKTVPMKGTRVTVQEKTPGGLQRVTRTLYSTRYGPLFDSIEGIPLPWTSTTAWALGDVNDQNFRYLNHFFLTDQAQSVRQYNHIERSYQGIPWVNSIAADREGHAYYTMDGAIPYVTDAKARRCAAAGAGAGVFAATGLPFLDGSRSACRWSSSRKAAAPGIFPPDKVPRLERSDYVENSNDSHWLANPHHPLVGFARVIGDQGTERSMRTRLGLTMIEQRLRGTDGLPGKGFTLRDLTKVALNDRVYSAEQWRDPLVRFCRAHPVLVGSSGPVNVSAACPVLAKWDLRYDLDAPGAVLFRRFTERLYSTTTRLPTGTASGQWEGADAFFAHPFDPSNPVNTPSGLDTANPLVGKALADAVQDLRSANIPLDATLRRYQYVTRAGRRIPIHGGPGDPYGVFNAISSDWQPPKGYPDVTHGSSFIAAMGFSGGSCPVRQYTFVTYSESENPSSPHSSDYTRAFSRKHWEPEPFCAGQVRRQAQSTERVTAR